MQRATCNGWTERAGLSRSAARSSRFTATKASSIANVGCAERAYRRAAHRNHKALFLPLLLIVFATILFDCLTFGRRTGDAEEFLHFDLNLIRHIRMFLEE